MQSDPSLQDSALPLPGRGSQIPGLHPPAPTPLSWTVALQGPLSVGFSRQEYCRGCHGLLQGIFPTQGSNPGLLHWQTGSLPLGSFYIYIYMSMHTHTHILLRILFRDGLSQGIEYCSLLYIVRPCYLVILHITVCILEAQAANPSVPYPVSPPRRFYVCSLCP